MNAQSLDGNFNDGPVRNPGRNTQADRSLSSMTLRALQFMQWVKAITSGTAALGTGKKNWNSHRNNATGNCSLQVTELD